MRDSITFFLQYLGDGMENFDRRATKMLEQPLLTRLIFLIRHHLQKADQKRANMLLDRGLS